MKNRTNISYLSISFQIKLNYFEIIYLIQLRISKKITLQNI